MSKRTYTVRAEVDLGEQCETQQSTAELVLTMLRSVAGMSEEILKQTDEKLQCLCVPFEPREKIIQTNCRGREFPPYFSDLRMEIQRIEKNLEAIHVRILKCEI